MPVAIDVNTEALIKYSKKLDRISKRALPRATRNTLNSLAFDTKKRTLLEESEKSFTNRNKTFFRRFSRVKMVDTNNINTMKSTVGMIDSGSGTSEQAGRNMKQQQVGGSIGGRALIPMDTARVGGKNEKNVRPINRVKNLNTVLDSRISRANKPRQRLIKTAIQAVERHGNTAVIKHTAQNGKTFLYRVSRGGSDIRTREFNLKVTPIYSVKSGRSVNIHSPKPFVFTAAKRSQRRARKIFVTNAKRQLQRIR